MKRLLLMLALTTACSDPADDSNSGQSPENDASADIRSTEDADDSGRRLGDLYTGDSAVGSDADAGCPEGTDYLNDPENCGGCGVVCLVPNAVSICVEAECVIESCAPGYVDEDGATDNGCEADCLPSPVPVDVCDGRDNDCDGLIDEDFLSVPCGVGVCVSESRCDDGVLHGCVPADPWESPDETSCDGIDGNCDGEVDEGLARTCEMSCGEGTLVCSNGEFPGCVAVDDDGGVCIGMRAFCEPVEVTVTLPLPQADTREFGADVFFVVDRSGSFANDIRSFTAQANRMADDLSLLVPDLALGLGSFSSPPCPSTGSPVEIGYELNLPLSTSTHALSAALSLLDIKPGGHEDQVEAMYQALAGLGVTPDPIFSCEPSATIPPTVSGWRSGTVKYLFLSTDEPFSWGSDYPYPATPDDVIDAATDLGVAVYTLNAGGVLDFSASRIAHETGGETFELSDDSSEIAAVVASAVVQALVRARVELVIEGDTEGFVTDVNPRTLSGIDLLTNETVEIDLTFQAAVGPDGTEQVFEFELVYFVNDSELARRPIRVLIPEVDPKLCENHPPIIRAISVPATLELEETGAIGLDIEEVDEGDDVLVRWRATAGIVVEPRNRSTLFVAPAVPGLIEVTAEAFNPAEPGEERPDEATGVVQVLGGECDQPLDVLDIGVVPGAMRRELLRDVPRTEGSCGGALGESAMVLRVHKTATYRFTVDIEEAPTIHLRARDCATELYCDSAAEHDIDLAEGIYYLFVDWDVEAAQAFELFVEPVE